MLTAADLGTATLAPPLPPPGLETPLDALANRDRRRHKPDPVVAVPVRSPNAGPNLVEMVHAQYYGGQED